MCPFHHAASNVLPVHANHMTMLEEIRLQFLFAIFYFACAQLSQVILWQRCSRRACSHGCCDFWQMNIQSLPMSLTKNSHTMIPWYNHTTVLSQISPVSTPHESSLRHDERARNHKLHRHKPLKTNSGSQHWQTMTMCCIFRVCLKRL